MPRTIIVNGEAQDVATFDRENQARRRIWEKVGRPEGRPDEMEIEDETKSEHEGKKHKKKR